MKRQDLFALQNTLNGMTDIKNTKLSYAILKNLKKIDAELEIIKELQGKKVEGYEDFENARIALCIEQADKDDNGEAIIENNAYKVTDLEAFQKELDKLEDEHREAVDAKQKQQKEFVELLNEECDLDFHKVKETDLPDDLTVAQLVGIEALID